MTGHDETLRQLEHANPTTTVDAQELAVVLSVIEERRSAGTLPARRRSPDSRRRVPVVVAVGAALLVLVVVGLPILFLGGGESEDVVQPATTVALTATTVTPTSVASTTTTTSTTTTVPGITDATKTMLAGLLSRLDTAHIAYTSPSEEDYPTDWVTIGDLEDALYVVWAPIAAELIDAIATVSANLKTLTEFGDLYDLDDDVDALVVAIDEWLVGLRWYNDPSLNCFPMLPDGARDLIVEELWNQTAWPECMYANITTEDMDAIRQSSTRVRELLDALTATVDGSDPG